MLIICGSYIFCHTCDLSHIWQNICHFLYVTYMIVPYGNFVGYVYVHLLLAQKAYPHAALIKGLV